MEEEGRQRLHAHARSQPASRLPRYPQLATCWLTAGWPCRRSLLVYRVDSQGANSLLYTQHRPGSSKYAPTAAISPLLLLTLTLPPAPVDSALNARTVREDTAELASYLLSDRKTQGSPSFLNRTRPSIPDFAAPESLQVGPAEALPGNDTIPEIPEPPSSEGSSDEQTDQEDGPSALANLLRKSPPESVAPDTPRSRRSIRNEPAEEGQNSRSPQAKRAPKTTHHHAEEATEHTPLLSRQTSGGASPDVDVDIEGQKNKARKRWLGGLAARAHDFEHRVAVAVNPKRWNGKAIWKSAFITPVSCLPAVCVGLLLNILDALSYGKYSPQLFSGTGKRLTVLGMILFPLGKPIFSHLGPAGISIFYVSTIVSQLTFSSASIFKGSVGSELVRTLFCCIHVETC